MSTTAVEKGHRPASVLATVGLLGFLGISATAGGIALAGGGAAPPEQWLSDIPLVDSWTVPGLVLGLGFGVGSLVTAYGVVRRSRWSWLHGVERLTGHHWSWLATIVIGLGHAIWIGLELVFLPELSWLQVVYGAVALGLLVLPWLKPVRRYLSR
jgi:hypothetical protein